MILNKYVWCMMLKPLFLYLSLGLIFFIHSKLFLAPTEALGMQMSVLPCQVIRSCSIVRLINLWLHDCDRRDWKGLVSVLVFAHLLQSSSWELLRGNNPGPALPSVFNTLCCDIITTLIGGQRGSRSEEVKTKLNLLVSGSHLNISYLRLSSLSGSAVHS